MGKKETVRPTNKAEISRLMSALGKIGGRARGKCKKRGDHLFYKKLGEKSTIARAGTKNKAEISKVMRALGKKGAKIRWGKK
jgi:hypothetical protein